MFVLCLGVILWPAVAYAKPNLASIKVIDQNGESVAILTTTAPTDFKVFTLNNPPRLVIDLPGTNPLQHPVSSQIQTGNFVRKVRFGQPTPGILRTVFDLRADTRILGRTFANVGNGYHLTIRFKNNLSGQTAARLPFPERTLTRSEQSNEADNALPASLRKGYQSGLKPPGINLPDLKGYGSRSVFVGSKPLAEDLPVYKPIIAIDPGHGGKDPGAISPKGLREKDVTLRYGKALRAALLKTGRYRVVMTRGDDTFIPLKERVEIARRQSADLFISIHADAHPDPDTRGFSVYTISERRARYEAQKAEKQAAKTEVIRGIDLSNESQDVRNVLISMVQRDTKNTSATFAETLVKHMGKVGKLLRRPHRSKSLAVLTGIDIPSALVELGYLTNDYEAGLLVTKKHQDRLISGMVNAIDEYYQEPL